MSETAVTEKQETPPRKDLSPEEAEAKAREANRARLAQLLDQGLVTSRLDVTLNDGRVPQWVRETEGDITRYETLGYSLESVKNVEGMSDKDRMEKFHGTGDENVRVGDLVLMSTSPENHADIQLVRAERRKARVSSSLGVKAYRDQADKVKEIPTVDQSVRHQ